MNHNFYKCSCGESACMYCEGGLAFCRVCKGFEGTLTKECCGRPLTQDEEDRIYAHVVDFFEDKWQHLAVTHVGH